MRLIDADKAREEATIDLVVHLLDRQPTIEAKPVIHAHWEESGGRIFCTNCGNYPLYDYFGRINLSSRCPTCGAQMDEPFPQAHENGGCCKNCTDHIAEAGKKENKP